MKKKIVVYALLAILFVVGIILPSFLIQYCAHCWGVYFEGLKYWDPNDEIISYTYYECVNLTASIVLGYFTSLCSVIISVLLYKIKN